ncbi:hypothetical protein [Haladaptatus sp. CMSO5]|uniref:hypothetical protein n=1 Tax=Haladaptatus sp. CMSO5 TaxID=3120514 RepID=UPI002FCE16AC
MTRYSTSRGLLYTAPPKTDRRTTAEEHAPTTAEERPTVTDDTPTAAPADD